MNRKLLLKMTIVSCFLLFLQTIQATPDFSPTSSDLAQNQPKEIKGTITSASDGLPLPGVNIQIKGSSTGTISDLNGNYTITGASDEDILVFSFIGMLAQEVSVSGTTVIDIALIDNVQGLEEVVVIGYGTVKKGDLTGSVSTVSSKEITAFPITNPGEALKGRSAGVNVIQGDAQPGESPIIVVRGRNSINTSNGPLWIVDGFPYEGDVNPEDIASMSILKDASSTAIYGSRGSNGVILVTTKKGLAERNIFEFSSNFGFYEIQKKLPMLNTEQYLDLQEEAGSPPISDSLRATYPDNYWQDEVYRNGFRQEYNLSYKGGNENTLIFLSGNYQKYDGIVQNSYYERFQSRMNLEKTINKNFKFGNNLSIFYVQNNGTLRNTSGREKDPSVSHSALAFPPNYDTFDPDGNYVYRSSIGVVHPIASVERIDKNKQIGLNEQAFAEVSFLKDFKLSVSLGLSLAQDLNQKFWPKTVTNNISDLPQAEQGTIQNIGMVNIDQLTYQKIFADRHNLSATLFYQYEYNRAEGFSAGVYEVSTDVLLYNELEGGEGFFASSEAGQDVLKSFGGRLNYIFDSKYFLTLTFRSDGSSKFSEGNKWANFPAAAIAWDISKENFMQNILVINQLKIRSSYGLSGNQAIGRYQTFETYRSSQRVGYLFNNVFQPGITGDWAANPDLKWETSKQFDLGLDVSMFKSRVNLVMDYYHKNNENLLMIRDLPATSFFTRMRVNAGEVENYGFETSLNVHAIQKQNFIWSITANYSFNRNKIVQLDEQQEIYMGGISGTIDETTHILREGYPLGMFYGYRVDGVFKSNEEATAYLDQRAVAPNEAGQFKIVDVNEDGIVDVNDKTFIGNPEPDFFYGLDNNFRFKDFSLNIFLQGSYGNEIYNYYRPVFYVPGKNINKHTEVLDRWNDENPEGSVPKVGAETSKSLSAYVEDGSYLRVRNISLSYRLPDNVSHKMKLSSLTLSASLQNWFTLTNYSGYDPESSYKGSDNALQGIDWAGYPSPKSVTFSIKVEL